MMILYKILKKISEKYFYFIQRRRFARNIGKSYDVELNNHSYKMTFGNLYLSDRIIDRLLGKHEPETILMLDLLIEENQIVIELGACYGFFTAQLSKLVGERGRVISVEPIFSHFKVLKENVELNGLKNVELKNTLIDSSEVNYYQDPNNEGFELFQKPGAGLQKVDTSTFFDFSNQVANSIDWLFMDIEGSEVRIIDEIVDNKMKINGIIFEMHEKMYRPLKGLSYLTKKLNQAGYNVTKTERMILARRQVNA